MVWKITENKSLSEEQIAFFLEKMKGTLLFIEQGDEWIPFGAVNEENLRQARLCVEALNKDQVVT